MQNSFGKQIKKYRTEAHLSQEAAANALGMSRTVFTQMENGNRKLTAEDAVKLASLFCVSVDTLLSVKNDVPVQESSQGLGILSPDEIADLLADTYEMVCFINPDNDSYLMLQNRGILRDLNDPVFGNGFFEEAERHLRLHTHRDDYREISAFLRKDALLSAVKDGIAVSPVFRVLANDRPVYFRARVFAPEGISGHLLVAVENVDSCVTDDQMRNRKLLANQQIIEVLSSEYSSIYYVDLTTDSFEICKVDDETKDAVQDVLGGKASFSDAYRRCVEVKVHEFDRAKMLNAGSVYNIVSVLRNRTSFVTAYRSAGSPSHYCEMKIARVGDDAFPKTVVIGFADRNEDKNRELEKARNIRNVIRLARNFEAVFDIDLQTGHYDCFSKINRISAENDFGVTTGDDLFRDLPGDIDRHIFEEDRPMLLSLLNQSALSRMLSEHPELEVDYRRLVDNVPVQYHMKIVLDKQDKRDRVIVGVFNVEEERRREQYYQNEVLKLHRSANFDVLTKVQNRNAYMLESANVTRKMAQEKHFSFGVALFDINDLKKTNDAYGHSQGDEMIIEASRMITSAFPGSPVFRIGGDEFVVLVLGEVLDGCRERIDAFCTSARKNEGTNHPVVAAGYAEREEGDTVFSDVFGRADKDMYRRKEEMKQA